MATARKLLSQAASQPDRTRLQVQFARPAVMGHCVTTLDRIAAPFEKSGSSARSVAIDPPVTGRISSLMSNARQILFFLLFLPGLKAQADVTLFVEAPINFLGHVSATGHAALLIDRLCSDNHIHMRWCRADEDGAVLSRYKGINGYDWVAMSPGPYLFAVDSSDEIPEIATSTEVNHLRVEYRNNHAGSFERDPPDDGWIQLLGASYRRRIICIHLRTTGTQDERLMEWLNRRPDRTHFNVFFSNCADFAG